MKCKFYATASVVVTKINAARSVAVLAGEKQMGVGNVTIPSNKEIPVLNALVEVRYLYAYQDGTLLPDHLPGDRGLCQLTVAI